MDRLKGKTAVITGGTTGLGFETARQFLAEGARAIITGQHQERLASAAKQLGSMAIPVHADVRSLWDLTSLSYRVQEEFGQLDILFVIALRIYIKTLFESSIDTITFIYQIHPTAAASNSSEQTTNVQSCLSLENKQGDTKSHILRRQRFRQSSGSGENWHYRSQSHPLVAVAVQDTSPATFQTSLGYRSLQT